MNNDNIDKFFDTKNGFVCIGKVCVHLLLCHGTQILTVYFVVSQILNQILTRCDLCQGTIST